MFVVVQIRPPIQSGGLFMQSVGLPAASWLVGVLGRCSCKYYLHWLWKGSEVTPTHQVPELGEGLAKFCEGMVSAA